MKVIYTKPMIERINELIIAARVNGKIIDYIEFSKSELKELFEKNLKEKILKMEELILIYFLLLLKDHIMELIQIIIICFTQKLSGMENEYRRM